MTDDTQPFEEIVEDDEPGGPKGGERLAEARRALQITVLEIAKELHLDEFKVRALESNDFDVIGAPVFAKGHLRKYAQLVKVSEADVMADYYQLTRSHGAPPALAPRPRPRPPISLGPWIAAIVVVLIGASGYWWYANQPPAAERRVTGQIAPLPAPVETAVDETEVAPAPDEPDNTAVDEDVADSQRAEVPPPAINTDSSAMQLRVTYTGDCWTEITDATGRRLFFDLGIAGRTINLSGEAPFSVLFGDADNVALEVNGTAFRIPASDRRGKTARLTISGS
jgi:cytoskeleton protein RodZ